MIPRPSDAEKSRIRNIVTRYIPSPSQNAPRLPCPADIGSVHKFQPSYGQTNFYSIGLISIICCGFIPCDLHQRLLPKGHEQQISDERRLALLAELERLDPPPYLNPDNQKTCRLIRSDILRSMKRKSNKNLLPSLLASSSSTPSTSRQGNDLGQLEAVLRPSPGADVGRLSEGLRQSQRDVLVFAFTKNNEPPVPIVATGFLLPDGDLAFVFLQPRILEYLGLDLEKSTGDGDDAPYQVYRSHFDQWVDEALDTLYSVPAGFPVIYRRRGVIETRDLDHYSRLTVAQYSKGAVPRLPSSSPAKQSPGSARTSTALATRAALLSSPGGASSSSLPTPSQLLRDVGLKPPKELSATHGMGADLPPSSSQSSFSDSIAASSEAAPTLKSEAVHNTAMLADRKGKRKARAPTPDDVIDLTETLDSEPAAPRKKSKSMSNKGEVFIPAHTEIIEIDSD